MARGALVELLHRVLGEEADVGHPCDAGDGVHETVGGAVVLQATALRHDMQPAGESAVRGPDDAAERVAAGAPCDHREAESGERGDQVDVLGHGPHQGLALDAGGHDDVSALDDVAVLQLDAGDDVVAAHQLAHGGVHEAHARGAQLALQRLHHAPGVHGAFGRQVYGAQRPGVEAGVEPGNVVRVHLLPRLVVLVERRAYRLVVDGVELAADRVEHDVRVGGAQQRPPRPRELLQAVEHGGPPVVRGDAEFEPHAGGVGA